MSELSVRSKYAVAVGGSGADLTGTFMRTEVASQFDGPGKTRVSK